MDQGLTAARAVVVAAAVVLVPTTLLAVGSRLFLALAVVEAAVLAAATAFAVFVGLYRYPH